MIPRLMDRREFFRIGKAGKSPWRVPAIILTTSVAEEDIANTSGNYANYYISQPHDIGKFFGAAPIVEALWRDVVQLPPKVREAGKSS